MLSRTRICSGAARSRGELRRDNIVRAQLHTISSVLGGDVHFAVRDAQAVLRGFREIMQTAPDGFQATLNLTPGERGLFISLCHSGPEKESDSLMRQIRSLAPTTREVVQRQPFAQLAEKAAATNPERDPLRPSEEFRPSIGPDHG